VVHGGFGVFHHPGAQLSIPDGAIVFLVLAVTGIDRISDAIRRRLT
jgi:hypothetical protein